MAKIKQILFDCGGVFVDIQFRQLIEKLTGNKETSDQFQRRLFSPESPWSLCYDKGIYTKEQTFRALLEWFDDVDPTVLRQFMDEWPYWLPTFPEMETIVKELHTRGYRCYLLSNFSEQFEEFEKTCPAIADLDGKLISYRIHMLKPHREIFEYAAETFGFSPSETLFIDDHLPNVEASIDAGYQGYHFTTASNLRHYLKEQEIL